jgi:hypothetical protein
MKSSSRSARQKEFPTTLPRLEHSIETTGTAEERESAGRIDFRGYLEITIFSIFPCTVFLPPFGGWTPS